MFVYLAIFEHQPVVSIVKPVEQSRMIQTPSPIILTESEQPCKRKRDQEVVSLQFQLEVIPQAFNACFAELRFKNFSLVQKLKHFHQVN